MLREVLARFGIQVDSAPLAQANNTILGSIQQLRALGGVIAGAWLVRSMRDFVSEMIQLGDSTAEAAKQVGVSAQDLQAWQYAAELSGGSAEGMIKGIRRLQKNLVDAGAGSQNAVRMFRALGVAWNDSEGNAREVSDALPDIADAFSRMDSATMKSAAAQELFGRAGNELLPLLSEGSAGIAALRKRFEELGGGLSEEFIGKAEEAQDALTDFDLATRGLKSTIVLELLPAVTSSTLKIAEWIAGVAKATKGTGIWEVALIALGAAATAAGIAMLGAFIKPLAIVALATLVIAGLTLAVEDFITFLEGGDSVLGQFLESVGRNSGAARLELIGLFEQFKETWGTDFPTLLKSLYQEWFDFEQGVKNMNELNNLGVRMRQSFVAAIDEIKAAWRGFIAGITADIAASPLGPLILGAVRVITQGQGPVGQATQAAVTARANMPAQPRVETNQTINIDASGSTNPEELANRVRRAVNDANRSAWRNAQRALNPVAER